MPPRLDSLRSTQNVLAQFYRKVLHTILAARIPPRGGAAAGGAVGGPRRRDRWFHLALDGDPPREVEALAAGAGVPLVVDVLLTPRDDQSALEPVVERWTAACEALPPQGASTAAAPSEDSFLAKRAYKRCIVLLRSIYAALRLLPAFRVYRTLSATSQPYNYDLSYQVSSFAAPFSREEEAALRRWRFEPVETMLGELSVSVQYRPSLAEFRLEMSSMPPPMLIPDYVGSPAAHPTRAFPTSMSQAVGDSGRVIASSSVSFRAPLAFSPSSAPALLYHRPHSWTPPISVPTAPPGGVHRPLSAAAAASSPWRGGGVGGFPFEDIRLSPPFSMSSTPSPPTFGGRHIQPPLREETTPICIPNQTGRQGMMYSAANLSDPGRNFPVPATAHGSISRVRDVKDDSGRFSIALSSGGSPRFGISRSSSRLSAQDDHDDLEFPFAIDEVTTDSQHRRGGKDSSETGYAHSSSHKSQVAAVGSLVHMLKTAPPLRARGGSPSSQSPPSDLPNQVSSNMSMSRSTSDALQEFRSYKELKDSLLSGSKAKLHESLQKPI